MKAIVGLVVVLVLLAGMFGIVLPQNSNTRMSNSVANANNSARNGKRSAYSGNGNANYRHPGYWVDGNTNRPLVNGTWNVNTNQWDIDANALYYVPADARRSSNVNVAPVPKKPRRKRGRPALAFSVSIENSLLAGMQARVGEK